jgi:glycosyl transferase family 1/glycosyl transferase family 4
MRILWVATKAPVPAVDGGRLVAATTLRALAAAGHDLTVVAPIAPGGDADVRRAARAADLGVTLELVPAAPRPWPLAAVLGLARGVPFTIARHGHAALRARVDALLAAHAYDVVHAEQVHAMAACRGASARGVPVVLRAQNVERDVWAARAMRSALLRLEAARVARFETVAVRSAAATVALTARDCAALAALAGVTDASRVRHVRAPFPADGLTAGPALPGAPAVVVAGSAGWSPNEDAAAWLTSAVWPRIVAHVPSARLHLFGARPAIVDAATTTVHPAPAESATLFPAGAIVVVPLRTAVGVRMRILEAWARGLPVVATRAAVAGVDDGALSVDDGALGVDDGALGRDDDVARAVALADSPEDIAAAVASLVADPARRQSLITAGAMVLRARHDPASIAAKLSDVYASAARART